MGEAVRWWGKETMKHRLHELRLLRMLTFVERDYGTSLS